MELSPNLSLLLVFALIIKGVIPLHENIIVAMSSDHKMNLSIHDQTIKMNRVDKKYLETTDTNAIKLMQFGEGYRLKFNKYSLFKAPGIDKLTGENFDKENFGFRFDLVSTEKGLKIKIYGKCLEVSKEGDEEEGYPVDFEDCQDIDRQYFETIRLPPFLYDNHSPKREVLLNSA